MRLCPYCHEEVYEDSTRCVVCNHELPKLTHVCSKCEKTSIKSVLLDNKEYCFDCANVKIDEVVVTTTNSLEGHRIKKYIGVESTEVVIGTGMWSEFSSDIQDFLGSRSTEFEKKLSRAKNLSIRKLKYISAQRGANAIVAMDLDYTEFSGNRIGVIASGTMIEFE